MYHVGYDAYCYGTCFLANPCDLFTPAFRSWSSGWLAARRDSVDRSLGKQGWF